jgi:predicted MFS family arabinose efflux permease
VLGAFQLTFLCVGVLAMLAASIFLQLSPRMPPENPPRKPQTEPEIEA